MNNHQDEVMAQDKELLQNLTDALGTLPCKKPKSKAKKLNPMSENPKPSLANNPSGCETPLTRKRRNSLDSLRSLSAKKSATISELKLVVSNLEAQITEINSVLKSQAMESTFEGKFQQLQDKVTQLDSSSKVNYQFLSAKVSELEAEICTLKAENTKLKKDIQGLKGNLKLTKRTFDDKLNTSIAELQSNLSVAENDKPVQQKDENLLFFPDDVETSNGFSALQEDPITTGDNTPNNASPPYPPSVLHNDKQAPSMPDKSDSPLLSPQYPQSSNVQIHDTPPPNEQKLTRDSRKDDLILLIDSNAKFIDTTKLARDKQIRQIFCPTIAAATKILTKSTFDRPSHIVIHVGTNDIEQSSIDSCSSRFQTLVDIASQKYPSSKVLISSLLKRRDAADFHRSELNSKLGRICAPFPNVHLVNNENIPIDYLHDNKHLKKRKIGALVTNMKDVIYNRIRPSLISDKGREPIPPLLPRPPLQVKFQQPILHNPTVQSRAHLYPSQHSYTAVASMTPPNTTPLAGSQMQTLNVNTVLELLKLYESTRQK